MIYTKNILKAIKFATKTHNHYQQQTRKGKTIPYITHPLTAGIILAKARASEAVIVAGILHDTIEDSINEKKVTPEMLEERFGKEVSELVVSVTEMDRSLPWAERKAIALEHIKHSSHDSILVKSADVLSNGFELVDDYWSEVNAGREGKDIFKRFKVPALDTIANYERLIEALLARWSGSPLAADLEKLAEEVDTIKRRSVSERFDANGRKCGRPGRYS